MNQFKWNQLRKKLLYNEGVARCLITDKVLVFDSGADIHEAIFKRNRFPKKFQAEHEDLIFSFENCALLDHQAHLDYGQWEVIKPLHIWQRLRLGVDMLSWVNSVPMKEKSAETLLIEDLTKKFEMRIPLILSTRRPVPGYEITQSPAMEIIWPCDEETWHSWGAFGLAQKSHHT